MGFKIGCKVKLNDYDLYGDYRRHRDEVATVYGVDGDRVRIRWDDGEASVAYVGGAGSPYEVNNKENENMEQEKQERPQYIIIVKNTEMFKKGGVLENYGSFWNPESVESVYNVKPYDTNYITAKHGDVLLEKKIAVPAVKFNPEFVTLEQEEVLTKALNDFNKPPQKKSTAKKPSTKTVKK